MAYTKLILGLQQSNSAVNTSFTFSSTNTSYLTAQQQIQQISLQGGVFADNGTWYPLNAILWIQPQ